MTGMIFGILFFAIPVLILVFLGICIFRYVSAKSCDVSALTPPPESPIMGTQSNSFRAVGSKAML